MSDFIAALDREIAELELALRADPVYVKLQHLRGVRDLYAGARTGLPMEARPEENPATVTPQRRLPTSGVSVVILNAVRDFLRGRPYPTPTRDIMSMLSERGISVGGTNPQNAVSSLMSKAPELRANGRSGWVLVETKLADDENPAKDTSPAIVQPQNAPVESGEEVAHEKIAHSLLD